MIIFSALENLVINIQIQFNKFGFAYFEKFIQDKWILHDALDWLDDDGTHVKTSNLMLESLHSFLEHLLDIFIFGILKEFC